MLIRRPDGALICLDGRETAPAAARRDMFIRNGKPETRLSQTGALASGVPGAVAVYEYASHHFGKKKFADLLETAARLAENGFPVYPSYAARLKSEAATRPRNGRKVVAASAPLVAIRRRASKSIRC